SLAATCLAVYHHRRALQCHLQCPGGDAVTADDLTPVRWTRLGIGEYLGGELVYRRQYRQYYCCGSGGEAGLGDHLGRRCAGGHTGNAADAHPRRRLVVAPDYLVLEVRHKSDRRGDYE